MPHPELLLALLVAIAALARLAGRLNVPYPVLLVLGGLALGFIPGLPSVQLQPSLVLLIFLPPLLHHAAFLTSPRELRRQASVIGPLAVGLVMVTMIAVAAVAHELIGGLSWPEAFVLGAVVAPTDPTAATAIFRRLGVSGRLSTIVEGEALVNDGTGLVAFRVAAGAIAGAAATPLEALGQFVGASLGGIAIGLVVGYLARRVRSRVDDPQVEITLSLLIPYLAYLPAERLHVSGVLAAVAAGLYLAYQVPTGLFHSSTRLQAFAFWDVLDFLLNSVLFILVGLQVRPVLAALGQRSAGFLALAALGVVATVLVVRFLWLAAAPLGANVRERFVLIWSGMRGAVSLAAALSVPLDAPGRPLIIFLTVAVILATLVGQGLTLPAVVRGATPGQTHEPDETEEHARTAAARAALERLAQLGAQHDLPDAAVDQARRRYELRLSHLAGEDADGDGQRALPTARDLQRQLVATERETFERLHAEGAINQQVARRLERELDLEEERWGELEESALA